MGVSLVFVPIAVWVARFRAESPRQVLLWAVGGSLAFDGPGARLLACALRLGGGGPDGCGDAAPVGVRVDPGGGSAGGAAAGGHGCLRRPAPSRLAEPSTTRRPGRHGNGIGLAVHPADLGVHAPPARAGPGRRPPLRAGRRPPRVRRDARRRRRQERLDCRRRRPGRVVLRRRAPRRNDRPGRVGDDRARQAALPAPRAQPHAAPRRNAADGGGDGGVAVRGRARDSQGCTAHQRGRRTA